MKHVLYLGTFYTVLAIAVLSASDAKGWLIKIKWSDMVSNDVQTTYTHDKANNYKTVVVTGSGNTTPP
jgi:hypothetical protein